MFYYKHHFQNHKLSVNYVTLYIQNKINTISTYFISLVIATWENIFTHVTCKCHMLNIKLISTDGSFTQIIHY